MIELRIANKFETLHRLLTTYYRENPTPYENMLIIHNETRLEITPYASRRVQPLEWFYMRDLSEKQKAEKLQVFQKEIERFADFLILHYFTQRQ